MITFIATILTVILFMPYVGISLIADGQKKQDGNAVTLGIILTIVGFALSSWAFN